MVALTGRAVTLGPLERTPRAFWQDAWEAMRGDIVRALVEYITNCDDAYGKKGTKGRILVEVEHRRGDQAWKARVRDRATGMSLSELRTKIGRQGARTSGFAEGQRVRGNLGLGSKDPACFGMVTFESIKDGEYGWFSIDDQGQCQSIEKPRKATADIRASLGIPGNGTVVTLDVRHPVPCPRHDTLKSILSNHVLLRDIMLDENRELYLQHANKPGSRPERLRYVPPKLVERLNRKRIPVPGYEWAVADLVIGESDEAFPDEGKRSPTRQSGILITGRRAIYESTLFGFEGNPNALAFAGLLRCEGIDIVASDYDDRAEKGLRHPLDNPMPIISRRREGLVEEHPFYQALRRVVENELGPLVAAREKRVREQTKSIENDRTRTLLNQLAREASKFMQEAAEEEELDFPLTTGQEPAPSLAIIPPAVEVAIGSQRTLSVMAAAEGLETPIEVKLTVSPPDVVQGVPTTLALN